MAKADPHKKQKSSKRRRDSSRLSFNAEHQQKMSMNEEKHERKQAPSMNKKKLKEAKKLEEHKRRVEKDPDPELDENDEEEMEVQNDRRSYAEQIADFAKTDPELFEFLQKEEADLLEIEEEKQSNSEDAESEREVGGEDDAYDTQAEAGESSDRLTVLSDGKSLRVRLRIDPATSRTLVNRELVQFLDEVMHNPSDHLRIFPRALEIAVKAFVACVARVGDGFSKVGDLEFMVSHEKVFDKLIRLCFRCMGTCLYKLLNPIDRKSDRVEKRKETIKKRMRAKGPKRAASTHFKHWHKYGALTKQYLSAMQIFLVELQSNEVIVPAIRAVTDLADLFLHFPKLCKTMIKCLVRFWSRKSEEVRCISFVALCKIARLDPEFFPVVFKNCYTAYIANCKVVDEHSLPFIHFMQSSFAELTLLHSPIAYQYAFVYIRQFAIHLRNAMIAKRKDLIQTVYNWQFVKGLQLWVRVICEGVTRFSSSSGGWFRELVHPLVEIISSLWRLFTSAKFIPLRIHCIRLLLTLQQKCGVFIPVLASSFELLDELRQISARKPSAGKGSTKEPSLEKMLRLSHEQIEDAGVRHHLAQQLYLLANGALEELKKIEKASTALIAPLSIKLRHFLKTCANRELVRLFSQLKAQIREFTDESTE